MLQKKKIFELFLWRYLFDDKGRFIKSWNIMKRIFSRAIYYYNTYLFNVSKKIPPSNVLF